MPEVLHARLISTLSQEDVARSYMRFSLTKAKPLEHHTDQSSHCRKEHQTAKHQVLEAHNEFHVYRHLQPAVHIKWTSNALEAIFTTEIREIDPTKAEQVTSRR